MFVSFVGVFLFGDKPKAKEAEDEEVKKQKHAAVMAEISSSVAHLSTLQTPAPQLILMAEDSSIDECVLIRIVNLNFQFSIFQHFYQTEIIYEI